MASPGAAIEEIPDGDPLSRHFWDEGDLDPGLQLPFEWKDQYQERAESLIWRKYAPTMAEVHARGCERQEKKNAQLKASGKALKSYGGACTTLAGRIREIESDGGYRFNVSHLPENGDTSHVHVKVMHPAGAPLDKKMPKNDRRELVDRLIEALGQLDPHTCAA